MEKTTSPKLIKIFINTKESPDSKELTTATLVTDKGVLGDKHAKGGSLQISLMTEKTRKWAESRERHGFCTAKFNENFLVGDWDYKPGQIYEIGDAKIKISSESKKCYPDCPIKNDIHSCIITKGTFFAEVVKTGDINVGDKIREIK